MQLRTSLQDAHRLAESHRSDVRHVCPGPGGALHHVGARTLVMGIMNATPDSFSDGGENVDRCRLWTCALSMAVPPACVPTSAALAYRRASVHLIVLILYTSAIGMPLQRVCPLSNARKGCRATAQHRAERMLEQGCDVVDIGGQSTRPGAATVSEAQELDRVVPLVECALSCFHYRFFCALSVSALAPPYA